MTNIKPWLKAHNFKEIKKDKVFELEINNYKIEIDIEKEKIYYPNLKEIGRETTTNFSAEENFVILDIIIGLLKQGYLPNQISIEKGYKLGHNTKSGNADVTIEDNEGNPFLIIEAKTYGSEFEKEWKNTLLDGGQLFSYEKQENKAHALVLYASKISDSSIERIYHAIQLKDNDEFLTTLENPKSYRDAKGGNDKFEIWRDVYQQDFRTNGVLEETIKPFEIGKIKSTLSDLKEITHDEVQKKYNQFATILRKYNVGGRENAFDKLVNLFLAKIVDEEQNQDDLMFNWKGVAQDTYFDLVDRLQKLYQVGMEKFLNEKVSYVAEKDIESAFRLRKDAAKDAIFKYFKELKYFSNNDFTFLDVYNEQLFYQNSRILVEVVQMLQGMKLKTEEQNQFLGDLFEGFLDNGVKQSEGQFFTPLPIVKFIISSLPLENINQNTDIPKIIDYASGAGHFLNEYAEQIKSYVDETKLSDYYSSIYGIEKEYRLSKVAKVSAFMYGQDNINIIYGDALDEQNNIKDNTFSVIVANPPYSVKGFLETLSEKQRKKYDLSSYVERLDTNNSIELFFLERAAQLLKSEGVAGIIVPSSVLSNGKLYTKARKMLLENFDIIAISEFGSKTFGSTGTSTITLFLRKKKYPPNEADNYRYAVERWFTNTDIETDDVIILEKYCETIGVDYNSYCELQLDRLDSLLDFELFQEYITVFDKSKRAKDIKKKKISEKYSKENKEIEYKKALYNFIKEIEQEKVFYFALINSQKNDVIVVKSPTDKEQIKEFLGYEWSKRKGQEGIKYIGANITDEEMEVSKNQAINSTNTPLFNPINIEDTSKINTVIRNNFINSNVNIPKELEQFVSAISLVDMIDFTQSTFDAQIKTSADKKIEVVSKYPVQNLKMIADINKGQTITKSQTREGNIKVVAGGKEYAYTHNIANREANIITISASGANAGYVNYWDEPIFASDTITVQADTELETKYIFNFLRAYQEEIFNLSRGAAQPHVYVKDIEKFPIPVLPINIQEQIISEVEKLDIQYQNSRMKIEDYRKEIMNIFKKLDILCD
ncbi:N-6 DNA methylase [Streptococcus sp. 27098_8_66]|uniref:N-6 DNA methylase n=1 Tax=Streptococcus sp. 27098_8_66 TaxID=3003649 RepID=UPI00352CC62A